MREAVAGEDGERATLLTLRSAELCLDRGPHTEASWSAGSQPVSPSSGLRLVHEHDQGHRVETATVELADGRIPGRVSVTAAVDAVFAGQGAVAPGAAPGRPWFLICKMMGAPPFLDEIPWPRRPPTARSKLTPATNLLKS